jgi:hypothetical protein
MRLSISACTVAAFSVAPSPVQADVCRRSQQRLSPPPGSCPRPCECRRSGSPSHRTFELARRDVDQRLVYGPFTEPVFRHRPFPTGKSLLLAVEATKARAFNRDLAAVETDLAFRLAPAMRPSARACCGPHAVRASFSIISASASIPEARQKLSKPRSFRCSAQPAGSRGVRRINVWAVSCGGFRPLTMAVVMSGASQGRRRRE